MCLRQEARLNQLHFAWNVDQQTAMWHHLLHEARRFKACPDTVKEANSPAFCASFHCTCIAMPSLSWYCIDV